MDLSNTLVIAIQFLLGFLLGLTFKLLYTRAGKKDSFKELRPIKKVRYISPKLDGDTELTGPEQKHNNESPAA